MSIPGNRDIILKLRKEGLSILLIEQNINLALSVSDYSYVMHKGEIVYQGESSELITNETMQAEYIGVSRSQIENISKK